MDKNARADYMKSKKRMRCFYDVKARELMYAEEFLKSFKCIPKMTIGGVVLLIPVFIVSQFFAIMMELAYYVYIVFRKVALKKNPDIVYLADKYWNSGIEDWNKNLDNYLTTAQRWDVFIRNEMLLQQDILKRC